MYIIPDADRDKYTVVVVSIHLSRAHTDASHDPIEWRSSSIARKCVVHPEESPYFEVWIDFCMLAEVMNGLKSLNVCEGFSGGLG